MVLFYYNEVNRDLKLGFWKYMEKELVYLFIIEISNYEVLFLMRRNVFYNKYKFLVYIIYWIDFKFI